MDSIGKTGTTNDNRTCWATPLNLVEKTTDENAAVQTDYPVPPIISLRK